MFLNTFKTLIIASFLMTSAFAQSITFCPPDGWQKNEELSEEGKKIVFTPKSNQPEYLETLTITTENGIISSDKQLWNNLIEIKKEYPDFKYYKPLFTQTNSMGLGCSVNGGFCIIQRVESYSDELYIYTYKNNMPHYSQGLFGKWTNILGQIEAGEQPLKSENHEVFKL